MVTPVFEGPFDLLLHLITREQVDIYDVRVADIVDAYVQEIGRMDALNLDVATEFLLIAATLIEFKLRKLLPQPERLEMDEDLALLEERDLLLAKLLECQTFKGAGAFLERTMVGAARSLPRRAGLHEPYASMVPDLLQGVTPGRLAQALQDVLARWNAPKNEPKVDLLHLGTIAFSVADTAMEMAEDLAGRGRASFRSLTAGAEHRLEVIVRFLAVLELYKQGWVELEQAEVFGELVVAWRPDGPRDLLEASAREQLASIDRYEG